MSIRRDFNKIVMVVEVEEYTICNETPKATEFMKRGTRLFQVVYIIRETFLAEGCERLKRETTRKKNATEWMAMVIKG